MFKKSFLFFAICLMITLTSCKQKNGRALNALGERLKSSKNIGLVLGGGAALGAYEAGVWMFLYEYGISANVRSVAGSSVGSLNGVLIVSHDVKGLWDLWNNLEPSEILESRYSSDSDSEMQKKVHKHYETIHTVNKVPSGSPRCGGFFISGTGHFKETIEKKLNYQRFSSSNINFLLTRVKVGGAGTLEYVDKKDLLSRQSVVDNLLAGAAAKALFDCYQIGDQSYRDGGQAPRGDNIPWEKLESTYAPDMMIIISLVRGDDRRLPKGDKYVVFKLNRVYSIASDEISFSKSFTRKLFLDGYKDAQKLLMQ